MKSEEKIQRFVQGIFFSWSFRIKDIVEILPNDPLVKFWNLQYAISFLHFDYHEFIISCSKEVFEHIDKYWMILDMKYSIDPESYRRLYNLVMCEAFLKFDTIEMWLATARAIAKKLMLAGDI